MTIMDQQDRKTHHEAWCDPTTCDADDSMYGDRKHVLQGDDIELSMYNRTSDGFTSTVTVSVLRHVSAAAPTFNISAQPVCDDLRVIELDMTRAEFVALHAEMGRAIEATA